MSKITASPPCRAFASSTCRACARPTCVRILADFGADVIRIEPPAGVDPNKPCSPPTATAATSRT